MNLLSNRLSLKVYALRSEPLFRDGIKNKMGLATQYWKYRDFQKIVQICHHRTRTNKIEHSKSLEGKLQSQIWDLSLWERFSLAITASHSFKVNCQKNRLGCDFEDDKDQAKNKTDPGWPLTPRLNLQATSGRKTWLKGKTCTEDWAVDSSGTQKKMTFHIVLMDAIPFYQTQK